MGNKDGYIASEAVQDQILHKVAHKMWEKELVAKHKQPFVVKWSTGYGCKL